MPGEVVRLIGGRWRRRLLKFPAQLHIRPTSARVRETLFNWLSHDLQEAICLDAFAGSGALGLEALSRGARWVHFIDQSPKIVHYLKQQLSLLAAEESAYVQRGEFLAMSKHASLDLLQKEYGTQNQGRAPDKKRSVLEVREHHSPSLTKSLGSRQLFAEGRLFASQFKRAPNRFTIVFLDPPFYQDLIFPYIQQLEHSGVLSDTAKIYIEHERSLTLSHLPKNWQLLKSKKTKQVNYSLWQRHLNESEER